MGRPPKFTDEELYEAALAAQQAEPELTEQALCGKLGVGRGYINERAEGSEMIRELKERLLAIRHLAIERQVIRLVKGGKGNVAALIVQARNVIGWASADRSQEDEKAKGGKKLVLAYALPEKKKQ